MNPDQALTMHYDPRMHSLISPHSNPILIIPMPQMWELRSREVKGVTQASLLAGSAAKIPI